MELNNGVDSFAITFIKKIDSKVSNRREMCEAQGKYLEDNIIDVEKKSKY